MTAGSSPALRRGITRAFIFSGLVIFEFHRAPAKISARRIRVSTDAISALIASGQKLAGLEIQGRWVDVGRDPETLAKLEKENKLNCRCSEQKLSLWLDFRASQAKRYNSRNKFWFKHWTEVVLLQHLTANFAMLALFVRGEMVVDVPLRNNRGGNRRRIPHGAADDVIQRKKSMPKCFASRSSRRSSLFLNSAPQRP